MKDVMNIGGRLALICAVSAVILGIVNNITAPRIEQLKAEALQRALNAVVLEGNTGDEVPVGTEGVVRSYYPVTNGDEDVIGYVINLMGDGYGGDLLLLAGYSADGTLNATVLMDDDETPGLGKEAEKDSYMTMYTGKGGGEPIPVRKSQLPQDRADSISGATITFTGVGKALTAGSEYVKTLGGVK